jgi:threonine synthase
MDHALKAKGSRATIVGATSGDTGSAAVEAFREEVVAELGQRADRRVPEGRVGLVDHPVEIGLRDR